jgi:hypothetical protein
LMGGMVWFALILAVCVQYQHAATRHREALKSLGAAGLFPNPQVRVRAQRPAGGSAPESVPDDRPR